MPHFRPRDDQRFRAELAADALGGSARRSRSGSFAVTRARRRARSRAAGRRAGGRSRHRRHVRGLRAAARSPRWCARQRAEPTRKQPVARDLVRRGHVPTASGTTARRSRRAPPGSSREWSPFGPRGAASAANSARRPPDARSCRARARTCGHGGTRRCSRPSTCLALARTDASATVWNMSTSSLAGPRARTKPGSVGKLGQHLGRDLQRQPRLANPTPRGSTLHSSPRSMSTTLSEFLVAADERRELHREVPGKASIDRNGGKSASSPGAQIWKNRTTPAPDRGDDAPRDRRDRRPSPTRRRADAP